MNKYLIECINDCRNEYAVALAPSLCDGGMDIAADNYASEVAISTLDNRFLVTTEG